MSPMGLIHDEIDTSRAFGYYHDLPVVNARPDVHVRQLTELDEFVIIGNHGLWKHISYQTAVDIVRSEASDPMVAAQKLRDFAMSYGADGNTMLMVMCR
jgi:adenylate cyclase